MEKACLVSCIEKDAEASRGFSLWDKVSLAESDPFTVLFPEWGG